MKISEIAVVVKTQPYDHTCQGCMQYKTIYNCKDLPNCSVKVKSEKE